MNRLYIVVRFIVKPYRTLVIAKNKKEAVKRMNHLYGHSSSVAQNARIKRGKVFVLKDDLYAL